MRLVLDANVIVSALISGKGAPARILRAWENERFDLVVSPPILEEVERVCRYPKIQDRYNLPEESIQQFLGLIAGQAILVNPREEIQIIEIDPPDNRYLECALEGGAEFVVTGDRHILDLGEYRGVTILPPAGFLVVLDLEND